MTPEGRLSGVSRAGWAASVAALAAAVGLLCALVLPGLRWGLPSAERNRLTLGPDPSTWRAPDLPSSERLDPWAAYPNHLSDGTPRTGTHPRSAFNPVRSYHPDEYVIFKSLSGMNPGRLEFFHGFFGWPAAQFYVVGAALKAASGLGLVRLVPDMNFYYRNPEEMARLYVVGRVVTLLFAVGTLIVLWRAGTCLFGVAGGAAAAVLLAVTPLFVVNAHYMTADIPMLFWIALVLLGATRILRGGGWKAYLLCGVALGLAAGTRYQGALAACLIVAAHLARPLQEAAGEAKRGILRRRAPALLLSRELWLAGAVSLGVFLLTNPYVLPRFPQFAREFAGEFSGSHGALGLFHWTALAATTGLGIVFALASVASLWLLAVRPAREGLFVLIGLGLPALLLWLTKPAMARYMIPALLLPALLVGYAFALFDGAAAGISRRAEEAARAADTAPARAHARSRRRARWAPVLLLAAVVLATGLQSWAFAALYSDPAKDTRARAAEAIAANVPAGETIGIVSDTIAADPWIFETPALDASKYRLVAVRRDLAHPSPTPPLVVASDVQYPPVALRDPPNRAEALAYEGLFGGREGAHLSVLRFAAWPRGWKSILKQGPHDFRYANPEIVIAHTPPR